ncbi:MAG: Lipoprotein-releasing system transmembrane protein LolE [Candidatus Accumulibacter adjunctus]|uniref:Lipoprotein-releasing system transmembrane protein LolE n=1 Tax=Candidatus Accumulibacter adjunctus TaxID=1454001 RepID=A0A011NYR9_9PROT|nr:MAG: Lipoprotein-releasing system transmembrane protein LolE [Candidatus Accumulibacter adjunctus]
MLSLALRNILRHKLRTGMTVGAIVFGVVGLIVTGGFVQDILFQLSEATIHSQSGHLQVYRKGFYESGSRSPEKYLIDEPRIIQKGIEALPATAETMARISFTGLLSNGRSDLSIVGEGVEADKEARLGSYLKISAGRQLTDRDQYGILLGDGVATSMKLKPGDPVTLLVSTTAGATNTMDFEVVGVFQTFSKEFDARAVRIPLAGSQELFASSGANSIVVSLHRTDETEATALTLGRQLDAQRYEIRTWRELNDFYQKAVDLYDRQFGVLRLIVLLMVLLTVANTVNMSVFERIGEFGTLLALGNRSRDIFRLVILENALIGLIGALTGAAAGIVVATALTALGIEMPPLPNANTGYVVSIRVLPAAVASAFAIGLGATVLAAILPALRVSRNQIAESLRQNH